MMAFDQRGKTTKIRARIVTVDPTTRRVEAVAKDGGPIQVQVLDVPAFFRWPEVNEYWSLYRENNYWRLGDRLELDEPYPIENLDAGEAKIAASVVIDEQGRHFIAVDLTDIEDGYIVAWDAATSQFKAVPPGA